MTKRGRAQIRRRNSLSCWRRFIESAVGLREGPPLPACLSVLPRLCSHSYPTSLLLCPSIPSFQSVLFFVAFIQIFACFLPLSSHFLTRTLPVLYSPRFEPSPSFFHSPPLFSVRNKEDSKRAHTKNEVILISNRKSQRKGETEREETVSAALHSDSHCCC